MPVNIIVLLVHLLGSVVTITVAFSEPVTIYAYNFTAIQCRSFLAVCDLLDLLDQSPFLDKSETSTTSQSSWFLTSNSYQHSSIPRNLGWGHLPCHTTLSCITESCPSPFQTELVVPRHGSKPWQGFYFHSMLPGS